MNQPEIRNPLIPEPVAPDGLSHRSRHRTMSKSMSSFVFSDKTRRLLQYSLVFFLLARLVCMFAVPLTDTTEARYAEIARKMLETGDWITPQHDYGVPFWAKPPLSTWLSALSMKVFGVNEFGARLPSLLLAAAMLALVWQWTAARRGRDFALLSCVLLGSSVLFFAAAGAVMTDSSLAFCTTLAMIAFWQALHAGAGSGAQRLWGWLFFVALGFGLLAKGPLVGVITFLPIVPWVLMRGNARAVWRALPWIGGSLLMLAIALPWYLMAEHKTPGFLEYFIIGEHFKRFLHPGWEGDRYGHAHAEPLGMIWVFWLASAFPWSFLLLGFVARRWRQCRALARDDDGWFSYLLLWSVMPMIFFTAAHNIIWPYPFPALPAFAILAVELCRRARGSFDIGAGRVAAALALSVPVGFLLLALAYDLDLNHMVKSSEKNVVEIWKHERASTDSRLLYFKRREYSSEFYSAGRSRVVDSIDALAAQPQDQEIFLVIRPRDLQTLPPELRARYKPVAELNGYELLRSEPAHQS